MSNSAKKRKSFTISEKIVILAQVDANVGTRVQLASRLGLSVSTLSTIVKNREEIEKSYTKGGPFSKQKKSLKCSPVEEVETALAAWFKQAQASDVSVSVFQLKEMALHLAARLGIRNFTASNGWIDRFKKRYYVIYKATSGQGKHVNTTAMEKLRIDTLIEEIKDYAPWDIYSADETGLFYNLLPNKTLTVRGKSCHDGAKSEERITVLLACNADGSDKLQPLVIGKYRNPRCFKNVKKLPVKYMANKNAWITNKIFQDFLMGLDAQMKTKNRRIVLFVDRCAGQPQDTFHLRNVKIVFFPFSYLQPLEQGIINYFKCYYRKQLIRKSVAQVDGGQLQDATKLEVNVLDALQLTAEAWRLISASCVKNCFAKCGFTVNLDHEHVIEDIDMMLNDKEEEDWLNIKPAGIQFDDYITCDSALKTYDVMALDADLAQLEEETTETVEDSMPTTFLAALRGLETARKYLLRFDTNDNVLVMCNEIENEMYRLRGTEKQATQYDWIKIE